MHAIIVCAWCTTQSSRVGLVNLNRFLLSAAVAQTSLEDGGDVGRAESVVEVGEVAQGAVEHRGLALSHRVVPHHRMLVAHEPPSVRPLVHVGQHLHLGVLRGVACVVEKLVGVCELPRHGRRQAEVARRLGVERHGAGLHGGMVLEVRLEDALHDGRRRLQDRRAAGVFAGKEAGQRGVDTHHPSARGDVARQDVALRVENLARVVDKHDQIEQQTLLIDVVVTVIVNSPQQGFIVTNDTVPAQLGASLGHPRRRGRSGAVRVVQHARENEHFLHLRSDRAVLQSCRCVERSAVDLDQLVDRGPCTLR
eukprot:Colp12_sorted_trinity150504_noHs@14366